MRRVLLGRGSRRRLAAALIAAGFAVGACVTGCKGGGGSTLPELAAVPEVAEPSMDPQVRRQLEDERQRVEALVASKAQPGELAKAFGELGRLYHAYDLLEPAEACYANAEILDGEDPRWPYYRGCLAQLRGDLDAAAERLGRVLVLRPGHLPSLLRLGRVELARERWSAAATVFSKALAASPGSAAALAGEGSVALAEERFDEAAERFEEALAAQPQASQVHYLLGQALRRLGRLEEARSHLEQRGTVEPIFEDPWIDELAQLATGAASHLLRGGRARLDGMAEVELEEYRQAVAESPDDSPARQSLALALARAGELDEAISHMRRAVELDPESFDAVFNLGGLLARRGGDEEEARRSFERALELNPELEDAYGALGALHERANRPLDALAIYDRLLARHPDRLPGRLARASLAARLGRPEGLRDLEALVRENPDTAVVHLALGSALTTPRGSDRPATADLRRGLEELTTAVRLDPSLVEAHFRLANALGVEGRFREAAEHYRRVVEQAPGNLVAWLGEATALVLDRRFAEARERLEAASEQHPGSTQVALALAQLLAAAPDASVRDGARARSLAERLHQASPSLETGEVLAMALAETGRYPEAVELQRRLVERAREAGVPAAITGRLEEGLRRYQAGRPAPSPWP